jgi:hypothetical protein
MLFTKNKSKNKLATGIRYVVVGFDDNGPLFRPAEGEETKVTKHVGWTFNVPNNYKGKKRKAK